MPLEDFGVDRDSKASLKAEQQICSTTKSSDFQPLSFSGSESRLATKKSFHDLKMLVSGCECDIWLQQRSALGIPNPGEKRLEQA
jgi:hypothetical protein